MYSMTGYGKAELATRFGKIQVEISSVNNRFLEISTRMPRQFWPFEGRLKEFLGSRLNRGKISLTISLEDPARSSKQFVLNEKAVTGYYRDLVRLKKKLNLSGEIEMRDLLSLPDITSPQAESIDDEKYWPVLKKAADRATTAMLKMRQREGAAMAKEMRHRLSLLAGITKDISKESPRAVVQYRDKLNRRIERLLSAPVGDPVRLEEEIAIMADRTDITEECIRIQSHIAEYRLTLKRSEPSGKKLNFILQELNREANTAASKCAQIDLTQAALALKEEIEKLREMVQNIE